MEERVGNICRKETRQIYVGRCQGRCSSYALEQLNLGDRVIPVIFLFIFGTLYSIFVTNLIFFLAKFPLICNEFVPTLACGLRACLERENFFSCSRIFPVKLN